MAWNNIQIPLSINSKHCECRQRTLIESLIIGINICCSHYAHQGADTLCELLPALEVYFDQNAAVYGCNNRQQLYNNDEGLVKGMENEIRQPGPNPPPENTHTRYGCARPTSGIKKCHLILSDIDANIVLYPAFLSLWLKWYFRVLMNQQ